jgi:hypothetical protein
VPDSDASSTSQVVITFGRPVTDDDLEQLKATADVVEAALYRGHIDEDHVHGVVISNHGPIGDPAF